MLIFSQCIIRPCKVPGLAYEKNKEGRWKEWKVWWCRESEIECKIGWIDFQPVILFHLDQTFYIDHLTRNIFRNRASLEYNPQWCPANKIFSKQNLWSINICFGYFPVFSKLVFIGKNLRNEDGLGNPKGQFFGKLLTVWSTSHIWPVKNRSTLVYNE